MELTHIYARLEPDKDEIRYVGKANNPPRRLRDHTARAACRNDHCSNWLQSLKARGLKPRTEIIAEVPVDEWEFWEKHFIKYFRALGFDLTNARPGGEGGSAFGAGNHNFGKPVSEEQKQKIRAALLGESNTWRGRHHTVDARTRMSAAAKGKVRSPETREKIRAARLGKTASLETREKQSAASKGKPKTKEHCARIREAKILWHAGNKEGKN